MARDGTRLCLLQEEAVCTWTAFRRHVWISAHAATITVVGYCNVPAAQPGWSRGEQRVCNQETPSDERRSPSVRGRGATSEGTPLPLSPPTTPDLCLHCRPRGPGSEAALETECLGRLFGDVVWGQRDGTSKERTVRRYYHLDDHYY